jgi:hypothetical protein
MTFLDLESGERNAPSYVVRGFDPIAFAQRLDKRLASVKANRPEMGVALSPQGEG